jgi:iron complex outermembrane receptor protein
VWARGGLSLSSFLNYSNSYEDTNSEPDRSVSSWTTLDLNARYSFGKESAIDGLSIFVNARNVFNKDPPFVASSFNGFFYDGANADPLGRVMSAGLTYRW